MRGKAVALPVGASGSSPYSFGPSSPRLANHQIRMIQPISGISQISSHQPDRPVSCSRLTPTASEGSRTTSDQIADSGWGLWPIPPIMPAEGPKRMASTRLRTACARRLNSANHHNSDRGARPVKSANLEKHVRMAVPKSVSETSLRQDESRKGCPSPGAGASAPLLAPADLRFGPGHQAFDVRDMLPVDHRRQDDGQVDDLRIAKQGRPDRGQSGRYEGRE